MHEAVSPYVHVWDPVVRVGHWALVAASAIAFVIEKPLLLHVWAGYAIGAVVMLRIVWDVIGPRFAETAAAFVAPASAEEESHEVARRGKADGGREEVLEGAQEFLANLTLVLGDPPRYRRPARQRGAPREPRLGNVYRRQASQFACLIAT